MKTNKKLQFPKNFLWGASTSAFQIEGGNIWNDWYPFYKKHKIEVNGCGGLVADHYKRYREDFDLAKSLNQNAQRISIEWSRIEKEKGVTDVKEIEHYREVLKYLKNNGFTTVVTLHHFTSPNWFSKEGGWQNTKSIEYFQHYVSIIIKELGDYIDFWITINEPYMPYAALSFLLGIWTPKKRNPFLFFRVLNNLAKAHNKAHLLIHQKYMKAMVGISSNNGPYIPFTYLGKLMQSPFNYIRNFFFLDKIRNNQDFIGLNYYFSTHGNWFNNLPKTDLGWPIYPKGIGIAAQDIWKRYKKPILITENGLADDKDKKRKSFIQNHLIELHKTINTGVDILGYLHWSLLDNLELSEGFWPKFGLIDINFESEQKRVIKESALYYAEICKNNYLENECKL